jgi:hypothetical protein
LLGGEGFVTSKCVGSFWDANGERVWLVCVLGLIS